MTKQAATHRGTCQICGHDQKLPRGVLSLHGYTKQWGFFQGTCPGARNLPYEQSCNLLKKRVPEVVVQRAELIERAAQVRADRSIVHFDVTVRNPNRRWITSHVQRTASVSACAFTDNVLYVPVDDAIQGIESYQTGYSRTLLDAVAHLNGREADRIARIADQLLTYIVWATERINSWKLRELRPVAAGPALPPEKQAARDARAQRKAELAAKREKNALSSPVELIGEHTVHTVYEARTALDTACYHSRPDVRIELRSKAAINKRALHAALALKLGQAEADRILASYEKKNR